MNTDAINTALYRPLKNGDPFNKLFPKVSCTPTFLGSGNTTFTLEQMKNWAHKYKAQSQRISKKLKGKTVVETVNNIYQFLHDYLQYQADGYDQNLRSPACSWHSRKTGIDCKSYSLFASTILLNLNIEHSFRKIKQASNPNQWSHVYVVIPIKNEEFVIDGTIHYNNQVPFTEKEDLKMKNLPHFGLNAPVMLRKRDSQINEAVRNFMFYLSDLNDKGISLQTTNEIKELVKNNLEKGIDPKISFNNDGIKVNGVVFYFDSDVSGLGFLDPATISTIGGIFNSSIFSGLFSGRSAPSKFAENAQVWVQKIFSEMPSMYTDKSKLYTEMSYHLNWVESAYRTWVITSRADYIKEGHQMGVDLAQKAIKKFNESVQSSGGNFTKKRVNLTFPDSTDFIKNRYKMRKPIVGGYDVFTFLNVGTNPNFNINTPLTTSPTNQNTGFDFNKLVVLANGLFKDKQSGQVYTPQQVQQFSNNTIDNGGKNTNKNKSMSNQTVAIIAGIGVLALGTLVYLKK